MLHQKAFRQEETIKLLRGKIETIGSEMKVVQREKADLLDRVNEMNEELMKKVKIEVDLRLKNDQLRADFNKEAEKIRVMQREKR